MKAEAEQNAENDKKERERVDKLNQADSMIFQTENQLKELGDKILPTRQVMLQPSTVPSQPSMPLGRLLHSRCTSRAEPQASLVATSSTVVSSRPEASRPAAIRLTTSKTPTSRR